MATEKEIPSLKQTFDVRRKVRLRPKTFCETMLVLAHVIYWTFMVFTPQPLRSVGVLFSPMVSGWAGGWAAGKSLSGLYLGNLKV